MRILAIFLLLLLATSAHAYIGPGAGIPVLGSLIGIVVTIVVAVAAILFWPIRKMLKRGKNKPVNEESSIDEAPASMEDASDKPVDAVFEDKQD